MVMHLRDIEECVIQEIGKLLNMKGSAVRMNLMRARQKIKEQLKNIFDYEKNNLKGVESKY